MPPDSANVLGRDPEGRLGVGIEDAAWEYPVLPTFGGLRMMSALTEPVRPLAIFIPPGLPDHLRGDLASGSAPLDVDFYDDVRRRTLVDLGSLGKELALIEAKSRFLDGRRAVLIWTDSTDFECLQLVSGAIVRLLRGDLTYLELVDDGETVAMLERQGLDSERHGLERARATGRVFVTTRYDSEAFVRRAAAAR